jgi:hypothetical protein
MIAHEIESWLGIATKWSSYVLNKNEANYASQIGKFINEEIYLGWIHLAQNRDQWQILVDMVMKFKVP